jgi:DNA-binding LacI/PurR family transcriptional regulator
MKNKFEKESVYHRECKCERRHKSIKFDNKKGVYHQVDKVVERRHMTIKFVKEGVYYHQGQR